MSKARREPVVLGVEFSIAVLPPELASAVRFAFAHERNIVLDYVEDEKKVFLMSVETDTL